MYGPAYSELDPADRRRLADALGDSPETVIAVHLLRRGLCRAYVSGSPSRFDGAVVQATHLPEEPTGFGNDPEVLWGLLESVSGWTCMNVAPKCAPGLGALMEGALDSPVRYLDDVYHTLTVPAVELRSEAVRRLTLEDLALLKSAPADIQGGRFENTAAMLSEGFVAGAIVDGRLAGIAHVSAVTDGYADIGVATLEPVRKRGFATAAASIVARSVQGAGRTPVWSTGADNTASLRVARKLGFVEVSRRTYVIPARPPSEPA